MRYVFKRFSEAFELIIRPERYVRLDDELRRVLEEEAQDDGENGRVSAVRQMAEDMLLFGMSYRWTSQEYFTAWEQLTPREKEVAAFVCLGYTNRQISNKLVIAPSTVKTHIRNVLHKFRLNGKLELKGVLKDWDFSGWEEV